MSESVNVNLHLGDDPENSTPADDNTPPAEREKVFYLTKIIPIIITQDEIPKCNSSKAIVIEG